TLETMEDRLAPAVFNVSTTIDGVPGSLRQAIIDANASPGADTIVLPAGRYALTVAGANEDYAVTGDLDIRDDLRINGAGAAATVIDGSGLHDRVFQVFGVNAYFSGVTITGGQANRGAGLSMVGGSLTLADCVVSDNHADGDGVNGSVAGTSNKGIGAAGLDGQNGLGGGVYNSGGTLVIQNSSISHNSV